MDNFEGNPDDSSVNFLGYKPDPLRYDYYNQSPFEVHDIIASLVSSNARVLEVGCGSGVLGDVLRKKGNNNYVGVEPSTIRAQQAASKSFRIYNCYLSDETIEKLGVFDIIILADVLEHLEAPSKLLYQVKKIMQTDTCLIVSVPNVAHWSIRLGLLVGKFKYTETGILDATHLRWFTSESILEYLNSCGFGYFRVLYTSGFMLSSYAFLRRRPFRCVPNAFKQKILAYLVGILPSFFACQIVVTCRKHDSEAQTVTLF